MPKKRIWSDEDKKKIIKWYCEDEYTAHYIATNLLKCRESTVSKILKENNIILKKHTAGRVLNTKQEAEIIDLYLKNNYTQQQIAEKFNCSSFIIHNILKRNNIKTIIKPRLNTNQNDNYFDTIDTEHKAYWLGFIFADGCVNRNQLSIEIHEKDKELLEQFKKDLNINSKISIRHRKNTTVCCIRVNSKHLCETLAEYGIVPNKTKITKHLPKVDNQLLPHFLRGLIDGDGWISIDRSGRYHIGFVSNYSSTCEDFLRYCNSVLNTELSIKVTNKNPAPCIQIQSQPVVKQLATALYKDNNICLSRKYRLVEPLFDLKNDEDIV